MFEKPVGDFIVISSSTILSKFIYIDFEITIKRFLYVINFVRMFTFPIRIFVFIVCTMDIVGLYPIILHGYSLL